jgi:large subunit ribosomal protein L21
MYAIIRTGGKQTKVQEGDVIDVERLRVDGDVTFTPVLIVTDDGTVISGRERLKDARVTARVVGASAGPKVDIFKYKAKTGYRRRQGHRQKYTTVEVTKIETAPTKRKAAKKAEPATTDEVEQAATPAEKISTTAEKASTTAEKASTTAKKASTTAKKTASTAKKTTAKKPAPKKES